MRALSSELVAMIRALSIFTVTYVLMSKPHWPILRLDRPSAGLLGAVLMIAAGVLTPEQASPALDRPGQRSSC